MKFDQHCRHFDQCHELLLKTAWRSWPVHTPGPRKPPRSGCKPTLPKSPAIMALVTVTRINDPFGDYVMMNVIINDVDQGPPWVSLAGVLARRCCTKHPPRDLKSCVCGGGGHGGGGGWWMWTWWWWLVDNLCKRSRFWKSKKTTHVSATVGSRSRGALAGGIKIIIWNICWFDMSGKSGEKYRGVSEVEVPTVWDCISSIIGSSIYLRVSHSVHRHLHQLAGK